MHKNRAFLALLFFIAATTCLFAGRAFVKLHHYYSLTNRVELEVKNWSIEGNGSDQYRLYAHYVSPFGEGTSVVGPVYRNPWAAERAKERFEKQPLEAWFNPKKRELFLSKKFPTKPLLSGLVLLAITIYFIILGVYVTAQDRQRRI